MTDGFAEAQALLRAGRIAEAQVHLETLLIAEPRHGGALHMLGLAALQGGDAARAVTLMRQAAQIDGDVPALHANLGFALLACDRQEEAAASFANALALNPTLEPARQGVGEVCALLAARALAAGAAPAALGYVRQSLAAAETATARHLFAATVPALAQVQTDPAFRVLLTRALDENWGPPDPLSPMAAALARRGALGDALVLALLRATPNTDAKLEALLAQARRELLAKPDGQFDPAFAMALAWQCFLNDYVFWQDADETAQAQALKARLEAALAAGDAVPPSWVVATACYFPLSSVAGAALLRQRPWPDAVTALLVQQIDEPAEEKRLAATLPVLTPLGDGVSRRVREQYEENPYPRWGRLADDGPPVTLTAHLHAKFPHAALDGLPEAPEILSAGCGTGPFALGLARRVSHASLTAVDLSRASLAYAARKAAEAGATVRFGQADILQIEALGRRFDVIEASGVLHHLANPFAGWRALLGQLQPGGLMLLGFYSAAARRSVTAARAWIAREGFAADAHGIRACRARMMAEPDAPFAALLAWPDFYSISAARDLLFHAQETCLTLDEIAAFLAAHELEFVGFEIGHAVLAAYRARFPNDTAATALGHWRDFESEHPDTFAAMYQFWVRRRI